MAGIKPFVDNDAVRIRYALEDLVDVNEVLDSGLVAAHTFFERVLGTSFEEVVDKTDVFYLDDDLFPILPNQQFRLRLKYAFLMPGSVSINFSDTRKHLSSDPVVVPTEDYVVDYDKGLVYVDVGMGQDARGHLTEFTNSYVKQFVSVTYTAGFGSTSKVKAPDWLKEAVLLYMSSVLIYAAHKDEPERVARQAVQIQNNAANSVERYKRETALQLLPIY